MAINLLRERYVISYSANGTGICYVNFGGAAAADQTSIALLPGGSIDSNFGPVSTQAIHILAPNGDFVSAFEM
jgi:hypothetical protein